LIELPETVSTKNVYKSSNGKEQIIIVVSKSNMRKLLSEEVSRLVEVITSNKE